MERKNAQFFVTIRPSKGALWQKKKKALDPEGWWLGEIGDKALWSNRFNSADDIVYPLLQIKSPLELWTKLESFYMKKSLTNKWYPWQISGISKSKCIS